jgi:hypothetical protein
MPSKQQEESKRQAQLIPKTGDSMFFRNVGKHLPDYMASYLTRQYSLFPYFLPYPNVLIKVLFSDTLVLSSWLGFYSRTKQEAERSALFEFRE